MTDLSPLPSPTARDHVAAPPHGAEAGDRVRGRWVPDTLARLDWRRIVELARALAVSAGWEPGSTRISSDGMTEFGMTKAVGSNVTRIWARLAPWNCWRASNRCLEDFWRDLTPHVGVRGTYIAPGGASNAARAGAARADIELLDADALAAALNGLPPAHSNFFYELTMSGQAFVPSCPVCLRPLSQSTETEERAKSGKLPDLNYRISDTVDEPVVARRIQIRRHCEIHFLSGVRARDVLVQGVVRGDFLCEGSLELEPGGVLTGTVAARSVLVRPGAELHGETRILNGSLDAEEEPVRKVWTCENPRQQNGCELVCFLPHSP